MSDMYSIQGTTLINIANSIRNKIGYDGVVVDTAIASTPGAVPGGPYNPDANLPHNTDHIVVVHIPGANRMAVDVEYNGGTDSSFAITIGEHAERPEYCEYEFSTAYTTPVFEDTDTLTFFYNPGIWGSVETMGYYATITGIDKTMTPNKMVEVIDTAIPALTNEELCFSGNCSYRFANNGWNWFVEKYADKITTKDITSMFHMFENFDLKSIPFEINTTGDVDMEYAFQYSEIECAPKINNARPKTLTCLFYSCKYLKEVAADFCDNWDWSYLNSLANQYSGSEHSMFYGCNSLRSFPMSLFENGNTDTRGSYSIFKDTFHSCYALDEIVGMPNPHYNSTFNTTTSSGKLFTDGYVTSCHRLKNFTFREMPAVNWALQTLDLSRNVGYASSENNILAFSAYTGITEDKRVTDDATYQALKDDPDYWTTDVAYSRFNHDSAVATINSLPSAIDYQTTSGKGANIVKFTGAAGSATDGGAINTLTDEEIAVATAKGWTVTLA